MQTEFTSPSDIKAWSEDKKIVYLDLSGNGKQIFVIQALKDGLFHYFEELKPDGVLKPRLYELILTSEIDLTKKEKLK